MLAGEDTAAQWRQMSGATGIGAQVSNTANAATSFSASTLSLPLRTSDYYAREVPLHVVSPADSFPFLLRARLPSPLLFLMRTLLEEERAAYHAALQAAKRHDAGRDRVAVNPLQLIHHHSAYKAALCQLVEAW